ncbi:MAG TPA: nucleotide exchange factor GrpE [Patescibacteria group bacterium]|nr:nucleotide exchange factor GrpE [Patescibacteria group bacterium]
MPRHREPPADSTIAEPAAGRGEPAAGRGEPADATGGSAVAALIAERDAALARAEENLALAQRAQADYANLKRRTAEEREQMLGLANEILLAKVVALADDFDRSIEHVPAEARATAWLEGIAAIDRKLRALLESEGVTPIEALGIPFDPAVHEAISHVPGSGRPENEVVAEIRRGYRIRDRVLRPALVAVSDGSGPAERPN